MAVVARSTGRATSWLPKPRTWAALAHPVVEGRARRRQRRSAFASTALRSKRGIRHRGADCIGIATLPSWMWRRCRPRKGVGDSRSTVCCRRPRRRVAAQRCSCALVRARRGNRRKLRWLLRWLLRYCELWRRRPGAAACAGGGAREEGKGGPDHLHSGGLLRGRAGRSKRQHLKDGPLRPNGCVSCPRAVEGTCTLSIRCHGAWRRGPDHRRLGRRGRAPKRRRPAACIGVTLVGVEFQPQCGWKEGTRGGNGGHLGE
jgi:hypothetical protein